MSLHKHRKTCEIGLHDCAPVGVLEMIFEYLPPRDTGIMQRVCKTWFGIGERKFKRKHIERKDLDFLSGFLFKVNKEPEITVYLFATKFTQKDDGNPESDLVQLVIGPSQKELPTNLRYPVVCVDENAQAIETGGVALKELHLLSDSAGYGNPKLHRGPRKKILELIQGVLCDVSVQLSKIPQNMFHNGHPIITLQKHAKENGYLKREVLDDLAKDFGFFRAVLMYLNKW